MLTSMKTFAVSLVVFAAVACGRSQDESASSLANYRNSAVNVIGVERAIRPGECAVQFELNSKGGRIWDILAQHPQGISAAWKRKTEKKKDDLSTAGATAVRIKTKTHKAGDIYVIIVPATGNLSLGIKLTNGKKQVGRKGYSLQAQDIAGNEELSHLISLEKGRFRVVASCVPAAATQAAPVPAFVVTEDDSSDY